MYWLGPHPCVWCGYPDAIYIDPGFNRYGFYTKLCVGVSGVWNNMRRKNTDNSSNDKFIIIERWNSIFVLIYSWRHYDVICLNGQVLIYNFSCGKWTDILISSGDPFIMSRNSPSYTNWKCAVPGNPLTHWGRDEMDAISQTTFSSAFSRMKMF